MCRQTEEVEPTVRLPRHRHFVMFLNVPLQALTPPSTDTGPTFLRLFRETAQF